MRALTTVLLLALSSLAPASAQDYFPLGDDDQWEYGHILYPPNADPDTVRYSPVRIAERVVVSDTAYTVIDLPAVPSDTLRVDAEGRVWGRLHGTDRLILDVTLADGEAFVFERGELMQTVSVSRGASLTVPAGTFEDVVSFSFDDPSVFDDEYSVTLARGIGVVSSYALYDAWGDLYRARVGGQMFTDAELAPLAGTARAFPNPFASSVTVELPAGAWTSAEVVDLLGRRVAALSVGACAVGCDLRWDSGDSPAGLYIVRVEGARQRLAIPVTVAR